ncbi:MAG: signal peptidase II [Clostridiales bacterium]|nr:signal peptidase II [Clostridiales bacterium]
MSKLKIKIQDFFFSFRYVTVMLLIGLIVAFWDFTLKYLLDGKTMPALNGIFSIFSTHNTGGAWSIFSDATGVLITFSIIFILALLIFNMYLNTKNYFYAISMGLLISGAFCNLYDRIAFGYVRDFINLEFINFPIFNIADIAICVGVFLLAIYLLFIMPKIEEKNNIQAHALSKKFVDAYIVNSKNIFSKEKDTDQTKVKKTNKKVKNAK